MAKEKGITLQGLEYNEQKYCAENGLERLRLIAGHTLDTDGQTEPEQMLAITRVNDLDIHVAGAVHSESPMLTDNGDRAKEMRFFTRYQAAEYEAINQHAADDGVFLAKTKRLTAGFGQRRLQVDVSTVEPSKVPYNHEKHIENTKNARITASNFALAEAERDEGISV